MAKILIIGAGEMQLPLIKKAKEMGLEVLVTDFSINAPGLSFADKSYTISTNDLEGNLEIARKYNVNGVVTSSDFPVNTVAYICKSLNLPGLSVDSAKFCTNKYLQKEKLFKAGLPIPKYHYIAPNEENLSSLIEDGQSYVLKPLSSSGSRGVHKVSNIEEFKVSIKDSIKYSENKKLLLEEFIDGHEYSVEVLIQHEKTNIIAVTEKKLMPSEDVFVEQGHIIPAKISLEIQNKISQCAMKAVEALKLNNCAAHIELKINNKSEVFIIEIGARLGGDYITSHLVPLSTGIDMLANVINLAIGLDIDVESRINMHSGVKFITSEDYEFITEFINNNELNIIEKNILNYKAISTSNSLDRLGYYIIQTKNREELLTQLNYNN